MSLINDALKKAQRDRESPARPDNDGPAPVFHAGPRPGNPAASRSFRWTRWIVAGTLVTAGTTAAVLFLLVLIRPDPAPEFQPPREVAVHIKLPRPAGEATPTEAGSSTVASPASTTGENTPAAPETPASPGSTPGTSPAPSNTASVPSATPQTPAADPSTNPAIAFNLTSGDATDAGSAPDTSTPTASPAPADASTANPVSGAQADTAATTADAASPAPVGATGSAVSPAPSASSTPTAEGPAPIKFAMPAQPVTVAVAAPNATADDPEAVTSSGGDPAALAFLKSSHIAGVKIAGKQSRVLMNNQVFFVGSVVDPVTQLRIKAITNSEIEFVDESGLEYRKRFQR
ncbi:hypothetical protein H5P28_10365 [Ruficoccus amylovorans]|uniref:Uncharacterized protein n=1 Tax=Ruficoccus amylovorans TaxID=1804625 RepID=A0A842HDR9_9BACT|nr:hypothetical protein [Ruficoccus amylovorans]MBC2594663.1 hypothetical protein [Ruficoccus amylovorans]